MLLLFGTLYNCPSPYIATSFLLQHFPLLCVFLVILVKLFLPGVFRDFVPLPHLFLVLPLLPLPCPALPAAPLSLPSSSSTTHITLPMPSPFCSCMCVHFTPFCVAFCCPCLARPCAVCVFTACDPAGSACLPFTGRFCLWMDTHYPCPWDAQCRHGLFDCPHADLFMPVPGSVLCHTTTLYPFPLALHSAMPSLPTAYQTLSQLYAIPPPTFLTTPPYPPKPSPPSLYYLGFILPSPFHKPLCCLGSPQPAFIWVGHPFVVIACTFVGWDFPPACPQPLPAAFLPSACLPRPALSA